MAQSFLDKLIMLSRGGKDPSGSTIGTNTRMPVMTANAVPPPSILHPAMSSSGGAPNFISGNGVPQSTPQEMITRARVDAANKARVPDFLKLEAAQNAVDVAKGEADKTKTKNRKGDFYTALMAGGFGLMGSQKRGLGAIGDAGLIGMQQYTNSAKTRAAAQLAGREQLRKESSTQSQNTLNTALAAQAIKTATGKEYAKTITVAGGRLMIVYKDSSTAMLTDPQTGGVARADPEIFEKIIVALSRDVTVEAGDVMTRAREVLKEYNDATDPFSAQAVIDRLGSP